MSSNKHKILFIAPFPPPVHGSAVVSDYIRRSKLINEEYECDYVNLSTSRRMDEIGKMSFAKVWRFISAYFIVFLKLLSNKYDLCYLAITCHGVGFLKDMPFVLLCKMFRRKILIHQHNKGISRCVDKFPYKWLLPLVYRNTKVILLSWHLYEDISKVVSREQVLICPNGIPDEVSPKNQNKRENYIPRILFLSNLLVSKGVFVLLDALEILKERGVNFICDFVGGETKEISGDMFVDEVKRRGLNELVIYHGKKYGQEKEEIYKNADIFTQPTLDDCFPLTVLEAMSYRLPVVSTDVGALPDEIEDGKTGFVIHKNDSDNLAHKLELLLKDEKTRESMGNAGYEKYKKEFTLERFEQNFLDCLRECLS